MKWIPLPILKRLRRLSMKRVKFVGTYADNAAALIKWRADHPVIVLHQHSDVAEYPSPDSPNYDRQMRRFERIGKGKMKVLTVWYVQDNAYNRLLGYRKERIIEDLKLGAMN